MSSASSSPAASPASAESPPLRPVSAASVNPSVNETGKEFDLIVIGAGAAGLSAALFASLAGLRVIVLERTEYVGGSSAFSAGTVWIPNSRHRAAVGATDSVEQVRTYLDAVVGTDPLSSAMREAFLAAGPEAVDVLAEQSAVQFRPYPRHPDYESDLPGATLCGRAMEPLPFDGRLLGPAFGLVRPPIPEFTVLGGMMVDRTDVNHLLNLSRSGASFWHALKLIARHALDRVSHPRGTRLVMGNALVARLLYSLLQRQVTIWTQARVESILTEQGRVSGVRVAWQDTRHTLHTERGVVLASGGFNRGAEFRAQLLPPEAEYSPAAPGHTGEALRLALELGAQLGTNGADNAFWAPVSVRRRADGSTAVFPHFVLDRAKPGTVVVNALGRRFVNESTSYHRFCRAQFEAHRSAPSIPAFLIADHRALVAYGLGMVRPGGRGLRPFLDDGYLVMGNTPRELAGKLGISPDGLEHTLRDMAAMAVRGVDPEFGRGNTAYQNNIGDPAQEPNPNLGALDQPPFYAVRLYPGDIGASTGLVTDGDARVLDAAGAPIAGLYACGNDMNSIMAGAYPGPGITLGPAITFGYVAARHAAGVTGDADSPSPNANTNTEEDPA